MGGINWTRVVLGGFVSGVVINVAEFVLNGVVLSKDLEGDDSTGQTAHEPGSNRSRAGEFCHLGSFRGHIPGVALRSHSSALWCRSKDRAWCRFRA